VDRVSDITRGAEKNHHYGEATASMVNEAYARGIESAVLLMRHSARTFDPDIHDLLNPLTAHGQALSRRFGESLPKSAYLRGYASPPDRCMDTAKLAIAAHKDSGGRAGRVTPLEALGVFYALDQRKMWKGLSLAGGLPNYLEQWFDDAVPSDAMMPASVAVDMILRALIGKLCDPKVHPNQLSLCVSHDMTVYTVRHGVGLEGLHGPEVEFLDGLLLFQRGKRFYMRSQFGKEVEVGI